jgi:hypothetical protein
MTISDGPGTYNNNANCEWRVRSAGAISISFAAFVTEAGYDFVKVYRGSSASPASIAHSISGFGQSSSLRMDGAFVLVFTSDSSVTAEGFVVVLSASGGGTGPSGPSPVPTWLPVPGVFAAPTRVPTPLPTPRYEFPTFTNASWRGRRARNGLLELVQPNIASDTTSDGKSDTDSHDTMADTQSDTNADDTASHTQSNTDADDATSDRKSDTSTAVPAADTQSNTSADDATSDRKSDCSTAVPAADTQSDTSADGSAGPSASAGIIFTHSSRFGHHLRAISWIDGFAPAAAEVIFWRPRRSLLY